MRSTGVSHAADSGVYGRGLFWGVLAFMVLSVGAISSAAQAQTPKIEAKQAEVAGAQTRIEATLEDLTEAQAAYDDSQEKLGKVEKDILDNRRALEKTGKELDAAQARLSDRAVGSYKSGGVVYLDVLLSVKSFADLSNKGKFVLQVLKQDKDAVVKIAKIKKKLATQQRDLEDKQKTQAGISARMREEQAAIDDRLAEQRAVYDSLSGEVQRLVQEEQARQAREAAERRAKIDARKVAEQQAVAEREAAAQAARQRIDRFSTASVEAKARVERQAEAEATARRERQRLVVAAAEADKKAREAKKKADEVAAEKAAEKARKAAAEQAAAEQAARAEQERILAEAEKSEKQAEQQSAEQQSAERKPVQEATTAANDQYAQKDATTAASDQPAKEDPSAAEDQYDDSGSAGPEASTDETSPDETSVTAADPKAQAILDNPNISMYSGVEQDIASGKVDSRVLDVIEFAAGRNSITLSAITTGHPYGSSPTLDALGYAGYPNAHYFARAIDIAEVDGVPVSSGNAVAQELASAIYDNFGPAELGSPWLFGPGSFSDAIHQNHIHVGWPYGGDGSL